MENKKRSDMEECVIKYKDNFYLKTEIGYKKIILTTDQDLIKGGIQTIDNDFLQWFVSKANDSGVPIDIVNIKHFNSQCDGGCGICDNSCGNWYKIITPKEEPKQDCFLLPNCTCKKPTIDIMKGLCKSCGNSVIHLGEKIEVNRQETLEEAAIRLYPDNIIKLGNETSYNAALLKRKDFIDGGNWVKERLYSEEECYRTLHNLITDIKLKGVKVNDDIDLRKWFDTKRKSNKII